MWKNADALIMTENQGDEDALELLSYAGIKG
jgi:hypothetical protein